MSLQLIKTCGACPEQYDLKYNGQQIGYFRLRHGHFRVESPVSGGETVFSVNTIGDGIFDESERAVHLISGIVRCLQAMGIPLKPLEILEAVKEHI